MRPSAPRPRPRSDSPPSTGSTVQDFVARQYYRHGLFCASHPRLVLVLAAAGVLWACWPLFSLPFFGGEVKVFTERVRDLRGEGGLSAVPYWMRPLEEGEDGAEGPPDKASLEEGERRKPVAYVQQVVVKAMVHPYRHDELIRTDAFRAPIASAFKLHLEDLVGFHDPELNLGMDDNCLRTDGLSPQYRASSAAASVLPEFGCLVLSPANLWRRDPAAFQMDPDIVGTFFGYHRSASAAHSSLAELLFGVRQRDTGLARYPIRNRQRVVTYAATVALGANHDPAFPAALRKHLKELYPLPTSLPEGATAGGNSSASAAGDQEDFGSQEVVHVFFPSRSYLSELLPFFITLFCLYLYVYFSCKKIDPVHSKSGVAFCAVVTVVCSILMSLGLSGLTLNMDTKLCVIPYLVTFISLENVMVVTRSVVSTQTHLDVRIRIAQGLSREGWNITKNLFAEITCLTFGFFIGILDSSIQEFCLLAVMGLLSDFFLQTFFFATVLSVDMNNIELRDAARARRSHHRADGLSGGPGGDGTLNNGGDAAAKRRRKHFQHPISGPGMISSSTLTSAEGQQKETSNVLAPQIQAEEEKEAKRVRLMNFFAKRRIIQRLFVLSMVVWLSMLVYQTSLLETLFRNNRHEPAFGVVVERETENDSVSKAAAKNFAKDLPQVNLTSLISDLEGRPTQGSSMEEDHSRQTPTSSSSPSFLLPRLLHSASDRDSWKRLPHTHWPALFALYNVSVSGGYVSILPPVHLSVAIAPDAARQLRHPREEARVREEAEVHSVEGLRAALELGEGDDDEELLDRAEEDMSLAAAGGKGRLDYSYYLAASGELSPFVPNTPGELFLAAVFVLPTLAFLLYLAFVFYRCVCSRNYAEWRASWHQQQRAQQQGRGDLYTQIVQESVPILMEGHDNEVECLVACESGGLVASLCLQGTVRTWDSYTGEMLAIVDRQEEHAKRRAAKEEEEEEEEEDETVEGGGGSLPPATAANRSGDTHSTDHQLLLLLQHPRYHLRSPVLTGGASSAAALLPPLPSQGGGGARRKGHSRTSSLESPPRLPPLPPSASASLSSSFKVNTNFFGMMKQQYASFSNSSSSALVNGDGGVSRRVRSPKISTSSAGAASASASFQAAAVSDDLPPAPVSPHSPSSPPMSPSSLASPAARKGDRPRPPSSPSPVWSMDCCGRDLVLGCADGSMEVWDAWTGRMQSTYNDGGSVGVTHLRIVSGGCKVVAARLSGYIEFFALGSGEGGKGRLVKENSFDGQEASSPSLSSSLSRLSQQRSWQELGRIGGHMRSPSDEALAALSMPNNGPVSLRWLQMARAHQQPVNCLESGGGVVITGSMDHTLRVFRLDDHFNVFTLHGHCGPVTTAFVDASAAPTVAGSGSQDGMICVWDLLTGACLYSILAHDGAVLSLAHSPSYVVSLGADGKICVWERCQGHLINTLLALGAGEQQQEEGTGGDGRRCSDLVMLTHNLLVTCGRDSLVVWDARLPDPVKVIRVGDSPLSAQQVTVMRHLGDTVACNFGRQLRLVHFPLLSDKKD